MNREKLPPSEKTKPTSRVNVAIIIFFVLAMTIIMALTEQKQCGCGAPGGNCPLPMRQIEQTQKPSYAPNRNPVSDDTNTQQSFETLKKE